MDKLLYAVTYLEQAGGLTSEIAAVVGQAQQSKDTSTIVPCLASIDEVINKLNAAKSYLEQSLN